MAGSGRDIFGANSGRLTVSRLKGPVGEWLVWIALGLIVYSQTANFDDRIAEYAFGATGWPRALCIAVIFGATGQLATQILALTREEQDPAGVGQESAELRTRPSGKSVLQRLGIFALPLIYLYVTPSLGFYLVTPFFVLALLIILEVKSPVTLAVVTGIVYGIVLLVFTRFFYVALPVGRIQPFYDINNTIITLMRTGM